MILLRAQQRKSPGLAGRGAWLEAAMHRHFTRVGIVAFLVAAAVSSSPASAAEPTLAGDGDALKGDHLQIRSNTWGFKLASAKTAAELETSFCAPAGTKGVVNNETDDAVYITISSLPPQEGLMNTKLDTAALSLCVDTDRVKVSNQYVLPKATLAKHSFVRTGVSFGGLVIPFKYRVGKEKELVSSPAIAPFVGFRTAWFQTFGLTFTPVAAAGLSLVPVADSNGQTSNRAAYTVAIGIRLTSNKNDKFQAGVLYGRDFLNKNDAANDPKLLKPWISVYLGASV
jgi:hypothetical protein